VFGSPDSTFIWDTATVNVLQIVKTYTDRIYSPAISPDGTVVAAVSKDRISLPLGCNNRPLFSNSPVAH
jgi:WD40 repeat protein